MYKGRPSVGIAVFTLALLLPPVAFAGEPADEAQAEPATAAEDRIVASNVRVVDGTATREPALSGSGLVVAIDPTTGTRRAPTAAEMADLSLAGRFAQKRLDGANLLQFEIEGGGVGLLLDSRYIISEAVALNPDGTRAEHHHAGGIHSIEALLRAVGEAGETADAETDDAAADQEVTP